MRIFFSLAFFLLSFCLLAQNTIHVIALMATEDVGLKYTISASQKKLKLLTYKISQACNYKYNFIDLSGGRYTIANAYDILEDMNISKNDIVIYYVMGHGWRYENHSSKYPNVFISYDKFTKANASINRLVMDELYPKIEKKGAKLNMVIFDACSVIQEGRYEPQKINYFLSGKSIEYQKVYNTELFTNLAGYIRLSTSSSGQVAISDDVIGSFFLSDFSLQVERALNNKIKTTWEKILSETEKSVYRNVMQEHQTNQTIFHERELKFVESQINNNSTLGNNQVSDIELYNKYLKEGVSFYKLGVFSKAIISFKKALKIFPSDSWTQYCINICEACLGYTKFENMDYDDSYNGLSELSRNAVFSKPHFAPSQYVLGILYLKGLGCKKNKKFARKWLELACKNGHVGAKTVLSLYGIFKC